MMKSFLLLVSGIILVSGIQAQSVLLERDLNESVYVKKKGPTKDHFFHLYYNYESYVRDRAGLPYDPLFSYRDYVGMRNYYRVAGRYLMGLGLEFGWEGFNVKQTPQKTFPSTGMHKRETLSTTNLGLEYFNRLLITQRENSLGVWLDAGVYGNVNLGSRHVTKDKLTSSDEARYHKEINRGLRYLNPWEYGIKARLGYKKIALTGTYRFSDWYSGENATLEPSRISVGLELGLY
jgi:hypothetical protein